MDIVKKIYWAKRSYKEDGAAKTIKRGLNLVRLYEPTGILDRYSHARHKIKVGSLVDRKLQLKYPTGQFLVDNYENEEFTRWDVIVRLLEVESIKYDQEKPSLVSDFFDTVKIDTRNIIRSDECLIFDTSNQEQNEYVSAVEIGYDGSLLSPEVLACVLCNEPVSFPVTIQSKSSNIEYPIEWFKKNDFNPEQIKLLESRYNQLLYDSGGMFVFILWPPANDSFNKIENYIKNSPGVGLTKTELMTFDDDGEFKDFMKDIYSFQSVKQILIDEKIEACAEFEKVVMIGGIEIPNPQIREHRSITMQRTKEKVREEFRNKRSIENSTKTPTIHSSDNFAHSKFTWDVIEKYSGDRFIDSTL